MSIETVTFDTSIEAVTVDVFLLKLFLFVYVLKVTECHYSYCREINVNIDLREKTITKEEGSCIDGTLKKNPHTLPNKEKN